MTGSSVYEHLCGLIRIRDILGVEWVFVDLDGTWMEDSGANLQIHVTDLTH